MDAKFCSSCGAAFQQAPRRAGPSAGPRHERTSTRSWFVVSAVLVSISFAFYSYRESLIHTAGTHSDLFYHVYDDNYGGHLKYTTRDGHDFFNCQYDTVTENLLGCDSCSGADRERLVAEAKELQKHGNGWRHADISDAQTVCPPDRETLVDLPDGFEVYCDRQRAVRVVLDSKECEGDTAPEGGVPVDESGSNKVGP